jgi:hypothetical protein
MRLEALAQPTGNAPRGQDRGVFIFLHQNATSERLTMKSNMNALPLPPTPIDPAAEQGALGRRLERFLDQLVNPTIEPLFELTIEEIMAVEPSARGLLDHAAKRFSCGYYGWCQGTPLDRCLSSLAGWFAVNPLLRSSSAYDTLQNAVFAVLQPGVCHRCECADEANYDTVICEQLRELEGDIR